jgi:hypothetical protein
VVALADATLDRIGALFSDHDGRRVGVAAMIAGITEASMTRRPSTPRTFSEGSTTESSSTPIAHVPTGGHDSQRRERSGDAGIRLRCQVSHSQPGMTKVT